MDLVQLVGGIFALVATAAGVVGYFRANVARATIELYKEDNTALRLRVETLEDEVERAAARIKAMEALHESLLDVVTQAAAISALKVTVDAIAAKLEVMDAIAAKLAIK